MARCRSAPQHIIHRLSNLIYVHVPNIQVQNNVRELFNLLQYLEENINATELEEKYAEMTSGTVIKLHAQMGIAQLPCRPQISRHN
jgi:hypothetical protein